MSVLSMIYHRSTSESSQGTSVQECKEYVSRSLTDGLYVKGEIGEHSILLPSWLSKNAAMMCESSTHSECKIHFWQQSAGSNSSKRTCLLVVCWVDDCSRRCWVGTNHN
jgi:hypothetical protein